MGVIILGIESSCDDTSASIVKDGYVLSNVMASQEVHQKYGGVVPELASRAHQQNIIPVVDYAMSSAGVGIEKLGELCYSAFAGIRYGAGHQKKKDFSIGIRKESKRR